MTDQQKKELIKKYAAIINSKLVFVQVEKKVKKKLSHK